MSDFVIILRDEFDRRIFEYFNEYLKTEESIKFWGIIDSEYYEELNVLVDSPNNVYTDIFTRDGLVKKTRDLFANTSISLIARSIQELLQDSSFEDFVRNREEEKIPEIADIVFAAAFLNAFYTRTINPKNIDLKGILHIQEKRRRLNALSCAYKFVDINLANYLLWRQDVYCPTVSQRQPIIEKVDSFYDLYFN